MIKEVDGKISGNIRSLSSISGNIRNKGANISGKADSVGQTIIYDAEWGGIKGDIENQDDLQIELRKRDTVAATVQEVEAILYLG